MEVEAEVVLADAGKVDWRAASPNVNHEQSAGVPCNRPSGEFPRKFTLADPGRSKQHQSAVFCEVPGNRFCVRFAADERPSKRLHVRTD